MRRKVGTVRAVRALAAQAVSISLEVLVIPEAMEAFVRKVVTLSLAAKVPTLPDEPDARETAVELLRTLAVNGDMYLRYEKFMRQCSESADLSTIEGFPLPEDYLMDGFERLDEGQLADLVLAGSLIQEEVVAGFGAEVDVLGPWFFKMYLSTQSEVDILSIERPFFGVDC